MMVTARTDLLLELQPELFYALGAAHLVQHVKIYHLQANKSDSKCLRQFTLAQGSVASHLSHHWD